MSGLSGLKKGDKVIMRLFTGAFSGVKEIEKADKSYIYFTTGKGMSKFSKKTGKMVDPAPKNERFANFIEEYDEKVAKAEEKKKAQRGKKVTEEKKPVKKVKKVVKKRNDVEELD